MLPRAEEIDAADISRLIADVSSTVEFVERHLLRLIRDAAEGAVAPQDLTVEFSGLSSDLQKCYRQVTDASERRDVSFRTMVGLEQLARRCLWLYRKLHLERAFYRKLDLEAKLRALISPEGYVVYQELLCIEYAERGFLAQSDTELRSALLGAY